MKSNHRPTGLMVRVLLAVAALIVATACSGQSSAGSSTQGSKITLTWYDYFGYSPASDQAANDLIAKYQETHPNVEIKRTTIGFADFQAKILQAAATGKLPDIAVVDSVAVPLLASQGSIADLSSRFKSWPVKDQFLEHVLENVAYDGKFFGVPLRSNTTALWYNTDHFNQAKITKPPTTWEELRATAKALTNESHAGICFSVAANEQSTFNVLPFIWQAGGDVDTIGDPASVDTLSFLDSLMNVDKSAPKSMLQWGHSDVQKQFEAGQCAMMINGPWVTPSLGKVPFTWAAAPLPSGAKGVASPLGGEAWVIGKNSKNVDAAWDVLTWLADSKNSAKEIGSGLGSIPNRNDTLNDLQWKWHSVVAVFIHEMPTARSRSIYGPKYAQISEVIWSMVQQVLTGQKKPHEAANDAKAKIQPLLQGK